MSLFGVGVAAALGGWVSQCTGTLALLGGAAWAAGAAGLPMVTSFGPSLCGAGRTPEAAMGAEGGREADSGPLISADGTIDGLLWESIVSP